ncbi:MAG: hypothetical protein AMXMBFR33_11810 [Candidatus Xenobia bacterium]
MNASILLLEDDDKLRTMLESVLEDEGYRVKAVPSGEEAIRQAADGTYDLIVTDIRMEGTDGLDALAAVKEQRPEIGSVVITGYSTEADCIRAVRLGVNDYLRKPFRVEELLEAIQKALSRRHQQGQAEQAQLAVLKTLLWGVESLCRALRPPEGGGLLEAGRLAARLARQMGLSGREQSEIQVAALLGSLERVSRPPLEGVPEAVLRLLEQSREWLAGEPPERAGRLESQLAAVAVASCAEPGDTGLKPSGVLALRFPDLFEESVLAALDAVFQELPEEGDSHKRRQGLLTLAQALTAAGKLREAAQTLSHPQLQEKPSWEGVQARLSLARLHRGRPEAVEWALKAQAAADLLGSGLTARTALEVGLLLWEAGQSEQARAQLERASGVLGELQFYAPQARSRLALAALTGQEELVQPALEVLLRAEHLDELHRCGSWVIGTLLGWHSARPEPLRDRLVARVLREFPHEVKHVLTGGQLSPAARLSAVRCLGGSELLAPLTRDPDPQVRQAALAAASQGGPSQSEVPLLRLYSLGGFRVFKGRDEVDEALWRSQKIRYLLACLAAQPGRRFPIEAILEEFWPGDPDKGRKSLNQALSVIRRCLEGQPEYLARTSDAIYFQPELPRWHDAEELDKAIAEADRLYAAGQVGPAVEKLSLILQLYQGPYLEGCYLDWAVNWRGQLEERLTSSLRNLALAAQSLERHEQALECSRLMLELDGCNQDAHLLAMQGYVALGRPEQALRQYELARKALKKDLGIEPSIALEEARLRAQMAS